jgi:hypothetical protein
MSSPAFSNSRSSSPSPDTCLNSHREYAEDVVPDQFPTLILTSHGQTPPLHPVPQLKFDVRTLPNPPKHIRDAHNGTSRRLQEWLYSDPAFVTRRAEISGAIESAMADLMCRQRRDPLVSSRLGVNNVESFMGYPGTAVVSVSNAGEDHSSSDGSSDRKESQNPPTDDDVELRVSVFCAMGKHRSVAMVEALSRMPWPGWQVVVVHRDLLKKRGEKKRRERKGNGNRGAGASYHESE